MRDDDLDAAWAHHEMLQHEFEEGLREQRPDWFKHRKSNERTHTYTQPRENDMKVSQMIESKFLKKDDFEQDQVCTIKGIKQENVGRDDTPEMRWTLYFNEHAKAMVLNITTIRVLEAAFGDESDEWKGKKVLVYVDPNVSFQGRVVGGLRLRPPKKQATPTASKVVDPDFDDSIPF